ncbi:MAG TPA: STAS domain-containing protein [Adhaeribacter sp.]|nr:STAS domain-containing protein [Adhaeribacter sp.]
MIRTYEQENTFFIQPGFHLLEDQQEALSKVLEAALQKKPYYLVVDCRNLEQICIPALRLLVAMLQKTEAQQIAFGFIGFQEKVMQLLEVTGIRNLLTIADTERALRLKLQNARNSPLAKNGVLP